MIQFHGEQLSPLNFWQLVGLFSSLKETEAYLEKIKSAQENIQKAYDDLTIKAASLVQTDKELVEKVAKYDSNLVAFENKRAKWENDKTKATDEYNSSVVSMHVASQAFAEQVNEFKAKEASFSARAVDLEQAYKDKMAELVQREIVVTNAEIALAADKLEFEGKQQALKAALKGV